MMPLFPDLTYFARRAEQEAIRTVAASHPAACAAHEAMRDHYCRVFLRTVAERADGRASE